MKARWLWILGSMAINAPTVAGSGILGLDHPVHYDNSGIWNRTNQEILMYGTIAAVGGGALWFGDNDKLGDTFWRSVDSTLIASASAQAMKWTFQRERPSQTNDPNKWFQGIHAQSFPSGEVAAISAAVTPFMVNYGEDHPTIYLLALLPTYDAIARVKTHGHWQSDVLVGAALGTGVGIWAAHRDSPWVVSLLPGGFRVGFAESTLYGWLSNPELNFPPAVKLGRNVSLYCTAAVDKWLADRTNAALAGAQ